MDTARTGSAVFDDIVLDSRFACGAGHQWRQVDRDHYAFDVPADPSCRGQPGYDYYFRVRVSNKDAVARTLTLDARRAGRVEPEPWALSRVPVFVSHDADHWWVADEPLADSRHEEYRIRVTLLPGETVFLTNSLQQPAEAFASWLRRFADEHPSLVTLTEIGRTPGNNALLVATVEDRDVSPAPRDRMMVTSGLHPAEPDWLATLAILRALVSSEPWARALRRAFVFDVVPVSNPDGFDLGTNATNASGVNMYWDFRPGDHDASPEAVRLWEWMERHPPVLYLDFHAYVFQLGKDYRAYLRPAYDYPPALRGVVRAIDRRLTALCGGRAVRDDATRDPRTLAPQLSRRHGTLTYPKFHVHFIYGIAATRQLSVDVFRAVAEPAAEQGPLWSRAHGYEPGPLDTVMRALTQSRTARRIQSAVRQALIAAGLKAPVRVGVALPAEPGLAPHWRRHLWSARAEVPPVFAGLDTL
ncbi:MAG: hypothetical protein M3R55_14665 [Acidobacteriota bacterium]|nr:hypothetical protein [Acidobacteriota bacterium]